MGIRIDGASDLINATDGSLTIEGQSINSTGIGTFSGGVKEGSAATIHSTGQLNIGVAATIFASGNATFAGIVTTAQLATSGAIQSFYNTSLPVTDSRAILQLGYSAYGDNSSGYNDVLANAYPVSGDSSYHYIGGSSLGATRYQLTFTDHIWSTASAGTRGNDITWTERARLDSGGRLLIGATSVDSLWGIQAALHVEGTDGNTSAINISRNTADGGGAFLTFAKSRGTSDGSNTIVQSGDSVGTIAFVAADGTDKEHTCAYIQAQIDGTPGANDLPGRLKFCTTADGASSSSERLRIDSSGRLLVGTTAARDVGGLSSQKLAIEGTDGPSSAISLIDNQNSAGGSPSLCFAKSRGTSVGSNTIVQDGATLGAITWCAADGNDIANQSAKIYCNVDAAPGSNDTAGRLIFSTSADGSSSPASRLEINKDGYVYVKTGNIVMSTSGTGIDFSATGGPDAGATGSSELLDDYEEGSWSGVVMDGGSTNISINNVVARYVKIGQYVHCYFNITRNETGSRSGTVQFWQLPFTALNSTMQVCGTFWLDEGGVTNGDSVGGAIYIHSNTNNAQFVHPTTDAQQSANRYLQYSEWSQHRPIYGSFSYMTQD